MIAEKQDAGLFREQLARLRAESWLGPRQWWPQFLFHFADVNNVVSILEDDALMSRSEIRARWPEFTDSAAQDVIDWTEDHWKDYVRFYFRPRTPTLYRNEGFRPRSRQWKGAHCPVPIYLLFDAEALLCRADSLFSDGNLANSKSEQVKVCVSESGVDFARLPFDVIYHDSRIEKDQRTEIVCRRHAEVIVPKLIDLEHLRAIWCRAPAEFETLRSLLSAQLWERWHDKISVRSDYNLFNREWVHVNHAALDGERIRFFFHTARYPYDAGPFEVCVEVENMANGAVYHWRDTLMEVGQRLDVELSALGRLTDYRVRLLLDDKLAYAGEYREANAPY